MLKPQIDQEYRAIIHLLEQKSLKQVFCRLNQWITGNRINQFMNRCEEIECNYKLMIKYTISGAEDPERARIYSNIIQYLHTLIDDVHTCLIEQHTSLFPYDAWATKRELGYILADLATSDRECEAGQILREELFHFCSGTNRFSDADLEGLTSFFGGRDHQVEQAHVVSALLFNQLKQFDAKVIQLLLNLCDHKDEGLKQRARVIFVLLLYRYDSRIHLEEQLQYRLAALKEDASFRNQLVDLIIKLIGTKETEKISKTLHDEILPEMIKISPKLKSKLSLDELLAEGSNLEDLNPDWAELMGKSSKLSDKIEKMSELQMAGADVFMSTFSSLKSHPFFFKVSNWFLPFYTSNQAVSGALQNEVARIVLGLNETSFMCNSDKYSFCFSLLQIPDLQRNLVSDQMIEQLKDLEESEQEDSITRGNVTGKNLAKQYIQDLYRFFKLYPNRGAVEDVFSWRFDFHNKKVFLELLDYKAWQQVGTYYFNQGYYTEAKEVFYILLEETPDQVELLQKAAFCLQQEKQYQKALDYYLRADLYKPLSYWNLRKVALCYRNLGRTEEALKCYRSAEQVKPDDLKNQIAIGYCLLELKQYVEALAVFFKLEYLGQQNVKVWRPIVWCCFVTGKLSQSQRYSELVLKESPNVHDFINRGHVEWALNNRSEAIRYYKKAIRANKDDVDGFLEIIKDDENWMIEQGIAAAEIPIILDQLMYEL